MPSIKDVVANYLTNPRTKTNAGEEFARASPSELVAALKAQAQGADLYVLGYSLFPLLKPRLKRDPALVKELIQACIRARAEHCFSICRARLRRRGSPRRCGCQRVF